jgi:hypothetical protein
LDAHSHTFWKGLLFLNGVLARFLWADRNHRVLVLFEIAIWLDDGGWLTVELDSSPSRPPKESARISKYYIESTLGIKVS